MLQAIKNYTPSTWDPQSGFSYMVSLSPHSEEYRELVSDLEEKTKKQVREVKRYQNLHDYGQFLIRGQLLIKQNPGSRFFKVRKFCVIKKSLLNTALQHNLDYRRLKMKSPICFSNEIDYIGIDEVLISVQLITETKQAQIICNHSDEYYIEYVVEFF